MDVPRKKLGEATSFGTAAATSVRPCPENVRAGVRVRFNANHDGVVVYNVGRRALDGAWRVRVRFNGRTTSWEWDLDTADLLVLPELT